MKNDGSGGPWGGRDDDNSGSSGGDGQRQPWGQPRRRRPDRPTVGPPAIEALLRKGRERFGGRLPEPAGRPLWVWGTAVFILLWLLLTCVHRINPQERGIVSRFGRYVETLQPGLNLTFPAPIDAVRKLVVDEPRSVEIGLGTQRADNPMLTADHNIVDLAYAVRWKIRDPEVYAYGLADPQDTIVKVAESTMRSEIANAPLFSDNTWDSMAQLINPRMGTYHPLLDEFFATQFSPMTGMWIHDHPELEAIKRTHDRYYTLYSRR